jgi:hypothetical protein
MKVAEIMTPNVHLASPGESLQKSRNEWRLTMSDSCPSEKTTDSSNDHRP